MRYLFINSVAGVGSTGRIAAEKCRELMSQGHECLLAYGRRKGNCDDIPTIAIGSSLDYHLHGLRCRILDDHGFGSAAATRRFLHQVKEYDPDVIWLHNIHGYYIHIGLLFDFLRTSGKKVIWTLHDCWAFTGHCAHFTCIGCEKWRTGCRHCPQKGEYPASLLRDGSQTNYLRKKKLFAGIPNLQIVTPCKWLAGLVKESFLREYPVEVIYNTVDTSVFCPSSGDFRENHGLTDKTVILGAAGIWTARKGFDDFLKLSRMLDNDYSIVLVGVTEEQARSLPANILPIIRTDSVREMAELYSCADVFVNPTYEDTFPTVNLEAVACGCPVICYDTCGCAETLGENDILVPTGDVSRLREELLHFRRRNNR